MRKKFALIVVLHILGGIIIVIPSPCKKSKMIKSLKVITIKEPSLKRSSPFITPIQSKTTFLETTPSVNPIQQPINKITNNKKTISPSSTQKVPSSINNTKTSSKPTLAATPKPSTSTINKKKLLELTQQSLKQIKGMETNFLHKQNPPVPSFIDSSQPSLNKSINETRLENNYAEELIMTLKNHLTLPDLGDTILSLIISPQGQLLNIAFDLSESPENEKYLKTQLPLLSFPISPSLSKNLQPIKVKIRLISENLIAIS
ncbi:hypothetical protein [Candidatus Clavichlamydia salmonicola]|uniref:hypothetical protein n=1 Tax=Candidatus Clavichlamydia salmonicola TaxID=469812 RepID=UPI001891C00F|nr:hypothetical protein [Candidatus Clavichlamydia salmonicola]